MQLLVLRHSPGAQPPEKHRNPEPYPAVHAKSFAHGAHELPLQMRPLLQLADTWQLPTRQLPFSQTWFGP